MSAPQNLTAALAAQSEIIASAPRTPSDPGDNDDGKTLVTTSPVYREVNEKSRSGRLYSVDSFAELVKPSHDGQGQTPGAGLLRLFGLRKAAHLPDLDAIATQESVFDGPLGSHYLPPDEWENKAAFDPTFRWTYRQESKARRKCDWIILLWISIMFFSLDLDRGNMANATSDNILKDLHLTQADYNLGNTLFRLGFLLAELPSQILGKKLGVDIWLPTQMCIFSALAMSQFALQGRKSFLALRFLIAFFQGGFIPDAVYFYTKNELPVRLAFFWISNYLTSIVSGFLAVGFLSINAGGHHGWQWLFVIEGAITLVIGIASFFVLRPGPSETRSRWLPNGYFTDEEVKIIVNKIVRDDPGKTSMHNRQALSPKLVWDALKERDMWPLYLIGLMFGIPGYPVGNYFSLSMRDLGFSTIMTNLLSIPNTVISIVTLVAITVASEVINNRTWLCTVENWWFLIFIIVLRVKTDLGPWGYFAVTTLLLGWPYVHAIQVGWVSRNSGRVSTRTVASSLYNMAVQVSAIIGANIYQASDDPPRYPKGNDALLGIIAFNLVIMYPGTWLYYRARNKSKERKWNAMTLEEQSYYLENTKDEGCQRLDFRFAN